MINVSEVEGCYGCMACVEACPKACISKYTDAEGFWYPKVNEEQCIKCKKCLRVCPRENHIMNQTQAVYGMKNPSEERREQSTSGGFFSTIAENILKRDGVIFASKFDSDWNVKYDVISSSKDLVDFLGSKYVQSDFGESYTLINRYLSEGRLVLVVGTPCQLQGVKNYFGDSENLYLLDFVCHGVPGPDVWKKYISHLERKGKLIEYYFRNKDNGSWHNSGIKYKIGKKVYYKKIGEDTFSRWYFNKGMVRESCFSCQFKQETRVGDLTMGDFWGIENIDKEFDDDKRISLVLVNTPKGERIWEQISNDIEYRSYSCDAISKRNYELRKQTSKYRFYKKLYNRFPNFLTFFFISGVAKKVLLDKVIMRIKTLLKK